MAEPVTDPGQLSPEDLFAKRLRAARWLSKQGFGIVLLPVPLNGDCQCPPKSTTRTNGGPCRSPGKHPLGQDWEHSAAHTAEEIDALVPRAHLRIMRQFGIFPEPGSGLLVLDEDIPGKMALIADTVGITLPPTFTVMTSVATTGERKRHKYWRIPDGYDVSTIPKTWIGGEVRVEGSGQVVGPWSLHSSGIVYEPEPGTPAEIAVLPAEFIDAMRKTTVERTRVQVEDAKAIIHAGEGRHEFLVQSGRHLWKGGIRGQDLIDRLKTLNRTRCNPPYPDEEMVRLADWCERNLEEPWVPMVLNVPVVGAGQPSTGPILRVVDDGFAPSRVADFPEDPLDVAFDGVAGLVAENLAYYSSASRTGLLMATLTFWGGLFGDHFDLYESQPTNIFAVLVGDTARGRKGTATRNVWSALQKALDAGMLNRLDHYQWGGLASGQALLRQMQDAGDIKRGVSIEEEFETVLRGARSTRDYNSILNTIINKAWDGRLILHQTASKTNSFRVEPPYNVGILGNITREVLRTLLPPEMIAGGFANRLLWCPVRGTNRAIDPTRPVALEPSVAALVSEARDWRLDPAYKTPIFTNPSGALIQQYYDFLEEAGGAYAKFTPRLHVMAARIAMVHALMDMSTKVTEEHIERAIALTEYCRSSLLWTFSDETGDDRVDALVDILRSKPEGLTAREYAQVFKDAGVAKRVRRMAEQAGLIKVEVAPPSGMGTKGGRPAHRMTLSDLAGGAIAKRFVVLPTRARGSAASERPPVAAQTESEDDGWVDVDQIEPNKPPSNPNLTLGLGTTSSNEGTD